MKKSLVRQFEEQFGKEWVCTCQAPFEPGSLEIISENKNSLIAHYVCPNCQREQMLAASIRHGEKTLEEKLPEFKLPQTLVSADDVLDIKKEVAELKFAAIKNLDRSLFAKSRRSALRTSR